jgi:hypothetical protein
MAALTEPLAVGALGQLPGTLQLPFPAAVARWKIRLVGFRKGLGLSTGIGVSHGWSRVCRKASCVGDGARAMAGRQEIRGPGSFLLTKGQTPRKLTRVSRPEPTPQARVTLCGVHLGILKSQNKNWIASDKRFSIHPEHRDP